MWLTCERSRNRILRCPAKSQAALHRPVGNAEFFGPGFQRLRTALIFDKDGRSLIERLLFACCPTNIAGLIMTVRIRAVQAMLGAWPRSHILKEALEGFPAVTHANTSAAIPLKRSILGALAPIFHADPGSIFRSHRVAFTCPMQSSTFDSARETPLRLPACQKGKQNGFFGATFASTEKASVVSSREAFGHDRPRAEGLPEFNDGEWHTQLYHNEGETW